MVKSLYFDKAELGAWVLLKLFFKGFYVLKNTSQFKVKYYLEICLQLSSVKLLSHVRLCDPMDCSMPGITCLGAFQAWMYM